VLLRLIVSPQLFLLLLLGKQVLFLLLLCGGVEKVVLEDSCSTVSSQWMLVRFQALPTLLLLFLVVMAAVLF